jgi:hypothetical protein
MFARGEPHLRRYLMLKKFTCGSFAVVAGTFVLAGFARDARATNFPEDGTLQIAPAVTMADLLAAPLGHRLVETLPDPSGGALQLTISDCAWATPTDVALNEFVPAGGQSDLIRFNNAVGGAATITFSSDAPALLPAPAPPVTLTSNERGMAIPGRTVNLVCAGFGASAGTNISVQAQMRSDLENPVPVGTPSDTLFVRASLIPAAPPAVPGLPPWGVAGLGLLLTGMGVILVRRQGRRLDDAV